MVDRQVRCAQSIGQSAEIVHAVNACTALFCIHGDEQYRTAGLLFHHPAIRE